MIQALAISIIVLVYLLVLSIIDIKKKELPAIFTTAGILVLAIVNFEAIPYGLIAFAFAWFLWELGLFHGVADIKVTVILGLLAQNINTLLVMFVLIPVFSLIYQLVLKKVYKKREGEEIPFLPVFFLVYLTLFIVSIL